MTLLTLFTSNRLDVLVDRLGAEMAATPLPPLAHEIVVVQSEGMQRWLTLELARRHGVSGSLTTPFPRPFCRWLARRVLDGEPLPDSEAIPRGDDSAFGREMLSWRLFARLGRLASEENDESGEADAADSNLRTSAPAAYLADDADQRKRYQLSQRLGSLFDDYQMFRPEMLARWQSGEDSGDEETAAWQAALWRDLVASAAEATQATEATEGREDEPFSDRLRSLTLRLGRARKAPAGLPRRVSVLGVSTLPPAFVQLLTALSRWTPVGVYFVSPTYHYWGDLRSEREQARIVRRERARNFRRGRDADSESSIAQHLERGNVLLAALGRQGREFFDILQDADPSGAAWHDLEFVDPLESCPKSGLEAGALARLQSDVLHLVDRGAAQDTAPVAWPEGDRSLSVHACHSPMREMEVLRDQLLRAFAELDGLRPSDVLVLVPDIELYGPLIQAVFGVAGSGAAGVDGDDAPAIPFSIADRRTGKEQPPSETLLDVLDLVRARATVREVFDLLDTPAVRRRFGLEASDLPHLRALAEATRVRWGFDGRHRHRVFDVPVSDQNTWRAGLDRLIMGYATGGLEPPFEQLVETGAGPVLPFAGDTPGAVEALGRFARFVETLSAVLDDLRRRRSFGDWAEALRTAVDRLFAAESDDEERGLQAIRDAADELRTLAQNAGAEDQDVHLQVVREHLGTVLSAEGFASGFLAGRVTFCALRPMRTIPFRVIAIAGLDDGAFPRRDRCPGFDLMARLRRPGDRSLRDDDRYLFLETLLAARDRLLLSYVGFSQRDAARREPSVVLAELLDQVDRTFVAADGVPARSRVVVEHRLQPWSAAYFDPGEPPKELFSYDDGQATAARALRGPGRSVPAFARSSADRPPADEMIELSVDELVAFWLHPPRAFCRALGIVFDEDRVADAESEPFDLGGLDGYEARQWLLERRLARRRAAAGQDLGDDLDDDRDNRTAKAILRARGLLPPGALGDTAYADLQRRVEAFLARVPEASYLEPATIDLSGDFGDVAGGGERPWRLTGRVGGRTEDGLLRFRCAALRPADTVRTWVESLAVGEEARLLGEDREVRITRPASGAAVLDALVDGYLQGHRRPLPVMAEASRAWAEQERALADPRGLSRRSPRDAAREVFEGRFRRADAPQPESRDPYVRLCFRDADPLDHPEVGRWAQRLWRPILDHLRVMS